MNRPFKNSKGFSLFELIIVLLLSSIMMGIVGFQFIELKDDLNYSANDMVGFLKRVRSKALASTHFYTITPLTLTKAIVRYSPSCSTPVASQIVENTISLKLGSNIAFSNLTWKICFTPRGISSDSATIQIQDNENGKVKSIEVVIGGAMRVL